MDENYQDKTGSRLLATEDKLWHPPLSPKDQQKLNRLRKKRGKKSNESLGFSGRTAWDWLNLLGVLAIPFVVTVAGLYFTQQITQQQDAANKQQHQTDLQIAEDQQRETTLKTYLDDMSDLLLNHNLRKSKPGDEVGQVARERTLTTFRRLDAGRNAILIQFLQDAQLIGVTNAVIDLRNANLSGDDLEEANLNEVDLSGAFLYQANLSGAGLSVANLSGAILYETNLSEAALEVANLTGAQLTGANLSGAKLNEANLSYAYLDGTILSRADLSYADLSRAMLYQAKLNGAKLNGAKLNGAILYKTNLSGADLSGADLTGANLTGTIVTQKQLAKASSLKGAVMPDGSKHP